MKKRRTWKRLRLKKSKPMTEAQIKESIRYMLRPRYEVSCYYRGYSRVIDKQIEKASGMRSSDSGMFLPAGLRDLSFWCANEKRARAVAARILRAKLPRVQVRLRLYVKP